MPSSVNKHGLVPVLRFPEFRDAGEWEEKLIRELGEIITGSTPSTTKRENYGGERLFVSPADISDQRFIEKTKTTLTELGFSKTRPIKEGSILFVCIGSTIGKIAQNLYECASNQQINAVIPSTEHSNAFIYYSLENNSKRISELAGNHAVPIINKTAFGSVEIRFPRLPEQQKIADCLSSIDELVAAQTQKLATLKSHKKGLMQQLFPAEGETLPKLRFPEFRDAGEWEEKRLDDVCEKIMDGTHFSPKSKSGHRLYLTSKNIQNGAIDLSNISYISEEDHRQIYKRCPVKKNDVLLTKDGANTGNCAINSIDFEFSLLSSVAVLRGNPLLLGQVFIYQLILADRTQKTIQESMSGQAITRITLEKIGNFLISITSIEEQQKIADCLSSIDELITAQTQKLATLKSHKKGLMQQLFPAVDEVAA